MSNDLDWNRPEPRKPRQRKPPRVNHMRKLPTVEKCILCGSEFHPWDCSRPQKLCSKRCASLYNLGQRTPDEMGYLSAPKAAGL